MEVLLFGCNFSLEAADKSKEWKKNPVFCACYALGVRTGIEEEPQKRGRFFSSNMKNCTIEIFCINGKCLLLTPGSNFLLSLRVWFMAVTAYLSTLLSSDPNQGLELHLHDTPGCTG
jgi:hypothetical protein